MRILALFAVFFLRVGAFAQDTNLPPSLILSLAAVSEDDKLFIAVRGHNVTKQPIILTNTFALHFPYWSQGWFYWEVDGKHAYTLGARLAGPIPPVDVRIFPPGEVVTLTKIPIEAFVDAVGLDPAGRLIVPKPVISPKAAPSIVVWPSERWGDVAVKEGRLVFVPPVKAL